MPYAGGVIDSLKLTKSPLLDLLVWQKPRGLNRVLDAITPKDIIDYYKFLEESVAARRKLEEDSQQFGEDGKEQDKTCSISSSKPKIRILESLLTRSKSCLPRLTFSPLPALIRRQSTYAAVSSTSPVTSGPTTSSSKRFAILLHLPSKSSRGPNSRVVNTSVLVWMSLWSTFGIVGPLLYRALRKYLNTT